MTAQQWQDIDTTMQNAPRCKQCGSTERTKYEAKRVTRLSSSDPWTHAVARRCRCLQCGQPRIDYTREVRTTVIENEDETNGIT